MNIFDLHIFQSFSFNEFRNLSPEVTEKILQNYCLKVFEIQYQNFYEISLLCITHWYLCLF